MLPKENRLRKKRDFEKVLKFGRGLRKRALFLKVLKNGLPESRFGFIISKKTAKKAVERNKIRRHLRETVRRGIGSLKIGYDVVFIAYPPIKELGFEERKKLVEELSVEARLLKGAF